MIFDIPPVWLNIALWTSISLLTYAACLKLADRLGNPVLGNPLLWSSLVVVLLLVFAAPENNPQAALVLYEPSADILLFMLAPATVALAVPLFDNRKLIGAAVKPIMIALVAGSLTAIISALGLAMALRASPDIIATMATKSITSPMAMMLSQQIFDDKTLALLAASIVIMTGLIGCVLAPPLFRWFSIKSKPAQGLAIGVAAHGIGTALLFRQDPKAAPYAALAMVVNGLLTVFLLPFFFLLAGLA